jgi:GH25 family lysozyme M1 (1,4-beta-N-acetylmuramidase)
MSKKTKIILIFSIVMTLIFYVIKNTTYAIEPSTSTLYQGIDVSDWQGYIDYNQVANNGIEVVYIKASQGSNIKDPYFDINYENAKANGLKVGFYHFLTATNIRRSTARGSIFCICYIRKATRL